MSIERQAVSALKWSAIAKVVAQLVSWLVTLLVIRLLSPDDYGLIAISAVIIAIFASIGELGLGASIVQSHTISKSELEKLAGALLALNLGVGLLVGLAAPLAGMLFNDVRLIDIVRVSALQFLFNAAATIPYSLATRKMRFKWLAFVDLVSALVTSLMTLVLAWSGAGVWALVLGNLSGIACRTTLLLARGGAMRPAFALQGISRHLAFGGQIVVARMAWQIAYQADVLIAGHFLTKYAVGVYSVSLQLATMPMDKVMSTINRVAFPTVARMQDELPRFRARLLDACRLLAFVAMPVLWGISAVSPEFVSLTLGERWLDAIFPLQVVTLIIPIRMISAVFGTSVSALGRADVDVRNMLLSCIVLPIAFLSGVQWGVQGLALSWVGAVPLLFYLNYSRMRRVLGIRLRDVGAAVFGSIAAGVTMYIAVSGARLVLNAMPEAYRFGALIAVGATTYLFVATRLDKKIWIDVKRLATALKE